MATGTLSEESVESAHVEAEGLLKEVSDHKKLAQSHLNRLAPPKPSKADKGETDMSSPA